MPRILAIDTTGDYGSLALVKDGGVVEELALHEPDGFGRVLFDEIGALLKRHEWPLATLDCFASASGPGSFTGVRIGLTAAKGLAEAQAKPIAVVSNLQAIAATASTPLRAVVIDARRGEVYAAVYDDTLTAVRPEVVTALPDWLALLPPGVTEVLTPQAAVFGPVIESLGFTATRASRNLAGAIGLLAERMLSAGLALDPAAAEANYVRRTDAELKLGR